METGIPTKIDIELYQALSKKITLIAFFLGMCLMCGITLLLHSLFYTGSVLEYALGLFFVFGFSLLHLSEFLVAVTFRRHDSHPDAFMLYNSKGYVLARVFTLTEFFVGWFFVPESWKSPRDSSLAWLLCPSYGNVTFFAFLSVAFYMVRLYAMVQCSTNFSLVIEVERRDNHVLVDQGIYSVLRHPSYFGFFWSSLCTQMLLLNPLSTVVYAIGLWRFFSSRIQYEEKLLESEEFFGDKYKAYRSITWVGIPFIP